MAYTGFHARNHPQQNPRDDVDDRALPPPVFSRLHERFRFTVDVAAAAHNTKLPRYYTRENSGLEAGWARERVYCNPPFSNIAPWVRKAWSESSCPLVVMLLPANRTEQVWWQKWIETRRDQPGSPLRVEFMAQRQRFLFPGQTEILPDNRPPFGCCLCIWDRSTPL